MQRPGTLSLYHPHIHGLTAEQVWGGLLGALVVEDDDTALARPRDARHGAQGHHHQRRQARAVHLEMDYMHGKEGDTVMVNGQVNPFLTMRPGQVQRWRILNASQARFYKLSLQGHTLHVIGTDGGLLDKPYPQSSMLLSPGERLDVLVKATRHGGHLQAPRAAVLAHGHDDVGADHAADGAA